jgi:tetratricopeptide (TPR) repeat protein
MPEPTLPPRARLHVAVARALEWAWPCGAAWAYADAIRCAPGEAELHFRMGDALSRARHWAQASRAFAAAVDLQPRSLEYMASLVAALHHARRKEELIEALRSLVALRPDEGELSVLLGAVLLRHGRRVEALRSFRWAVRLSPGHARRRFVLGETLLGPGGWEQALDAWQGARQLGSGASEDTRLQPGRSVLHRHPGTARARGMGKKPSPARVGDLLARALERAAALGPLVQRSLVQSVAGDARERRVRALRRAWRKAHPRGSRWPGVLVSLRRRAPDTPA